MQNLCFDNKIEARQVVFGEAAKELSALSVFALPAQSFRAGQLSELLIIALLTLLCIIMIGKMRSYTKSIVLIGIFSAIASVGRALFAPIPSVQPSTFIIITCGVLLGPSAGYFCGLISGLLSSFLTSLGPWTVWQMFCWGLIGLFSGTIKNKKFIPVFGLISGIVFGWVMNLWFFTMGAIPFTLTGWAAASISSFYFDLSHGLTNLALLYCFPVERVGRIYSEYHSGK